MTKTRFSALLCALAFLFSVGVSTHAATITVTRTDDRNQVNTCRNTGDCSLREAIGRSASGDLIRFSNGFGSPQTITLTGFIFRRLDVTTSITIQGPGANLLTITGNNSDRVFEIFSGTTTSISGLKVTGGNPQTVNFGSNGGGIIVKSGATLNLAGVTVSGNSAYDGGGIYVENAATCNLTGVTVSGNHAGSIGGAINNDFGTLSILNSTISGNDGNFAAGGIYNNFGTVSLTNATVTLNNAVGIYNAKGTFNVRNSVIAGNVGATADAIGGFNSEGYNLVQYPSGSSGFGAAGDILGQPAQLGALGNNGGLTLTHYPACSSPAVEGGDPLNPPVFDQRGTARPQGFRADIGAIETGCIVAVKDNTDASANSLRAAVTAVDSGGEIRFDPAFFNVPRTIMLSREILLTKSMTITGAGFVTLNGSDFDRIFNIQGGTVSLNSLNLTNGKSGQGGAIYNAATAHLNGVTVYANKGTQGGGVYNGSTMTVTNSTVSGNLPNGANSTGGGIYNAGTLTLVNSTITNNLTATGGGIYQNAGSVSVANTIIAGNSATVASPDVFGTFTSQGSNLVGNTAGATGFGAAGDVLGQSPQISALADNGGLTLTHVPTTASPALNAGNGALAVNPATSQSLTTDQRGLARSVVGVDIGATEFAQPIVTSSNDAGSGSLRLAVAETPSGNTIEFSSSYFSQPRTVNLTGGQIVIDKNLTVNAPANLTIDANLANRIFYVNPNVTFNLNGGNLTRGRAPSGGSGGAIVIYGTANLYNISISSSSAPTGDGGGAIANYGIMDVTGAALVNNSAQNGGAVANNNPFGTSNLRNTTISGNAATNGEGGGVVNFSGALNLYNVTVAFNTASAAGGGVLSRAFAGNALRALNTIIANNTAGTLGNDIANSIESQGYNIVRVLNPGDGGGFGATDIVGTSANPVNVGLRPLAANGGPTPTHSLLPDSRAINAGNPNDYLFVDQRGVSRPRGGRPDIGAFESSSFVTSNDINAPEGLRSVLAAAIEGDVITFDTAFFATPRTINLGGAELAITKALTIQGPGADKLTISGGNLSRVFSIAPGLPGVTLSGLTITQGGNVPNGGAIFNSSPLSLNNVVLTGNAAGSTGGAIYNNYSTVNLNNCTVSNNIAFSRGGGIYSENFGSQTPGTSTVNIRNSTFSGNEARGSLGGGILNNLGATRISNSTFSGNSSVSGGSAIYQGASLPLRIVNSTFTLNNDTNSGVAIISAASSPNDRINNSIVAGNFSGDIFGMNGSNNLIGNGDGTSFANGVNGNIVGTTANPVDPRLSALGNNGGPTATHGLQTDSPARNAGDNLLAFDAETNQPLINDQRGFPRIVQSFVVAFTDIGAFEIQGPTAAGVEVGGRVTDANGRGLFNVTLTLVGSDGVVRWTRTNPFGYYRFVDIPVGGVYMVSVAHKRFVFEPQVVSVSGQMASLDFVGSVR